MNIILQTQSLEFIVEMRILAEMNIKNRGKNIYRGKKSTSKFFSMKIKMMDLWIQIEGT